LLSCNDRFIKREIESEYKRLIIDRYQSKGDHFKIQTDSGEIIDIGGLSYQMSIYASVGDSIFKIKNKNICILKRGDATFTIKYIETKRE
jgi:hypothetical protein